MKANELMIGDWVRSDNETTQVTDIVTDHREMLCSVSCADRATYDDVGLQPIPLTAEILEKNRFEELMSEGERVAEMFGRKPHPTGVWMYCFGRFDSVAYVPERSFLRIKFMEGCQADIANIKYVHELQHALRLCGVEKEVVL